MKIIIHADGACSGNPGPGGWGATVLVEDGPARDITLLQGGASMTTNNIMELTAARAALEHVLDSFGNDLKGAQVTLRLDSEYVLKGMRDWMPGWKRKGWRTGKGQEVKNKDIWMAIDTLGQKLKELAKIQYVHVRGHSGDPENDRVDAIAVEARDASRSRTGAWSAAPRVMGNTENAPDGP